MPLASKEMMKRAIKDVSFAERLFSVLLFRGLHLLDTKSDAVLEVDGIPCACLDGLLFEENGIYGILVAEKEEECEKSFLLRLEGLLESLYETEGEEREVRLLCFARDAREEHYFEYLPFGVETMLFDFGITVFSLKKSEDYTDVFSRTVQDVFEDDVDKIRDGFLREKLRWTRWELKEQY